MTISIQCQGCSGRFRAPDSAAGKTIACPKCRAPLKIVVAEIDFAPAVANPLYDLIDKELPPVGPHAVAPDANGFGKEPLLARRRGRSMSWIAPIKFSKFRILPALIASATLVLLVALCSEGAVGVGVVMGIVGGLLTFVGYAAEPWVPRIDSASTRQRRSNAQPSPTAQGFWRVFGFAFGLIGLLVAVLVMALYAITVTFWSNLYRQFGPVGALGTLYLFVGGLLVAVFSVEAQKTIAGFGKSPAQMPPANDAGTPWDKLAATHPSPTQGTSAIRRKNHHQGSFAPFAAAPSKPTAEEENPFKLVDERPSQPSADNENPFKPAAKAPSQPSADNENPFKPVVKAPSQPSADNENPFKPAALPSETPTPRN